MQDTETPTTKPQGRGKSSNSILSSDICLLCVVLRMQTCCSGVCRTYTPPNKISRIRTRIEPRTVGSNTSTPGGGRLKVGAFRQLDREWGWEVRSELQHQGRLLRKLYTNRHGRVYTNRHGRVMLWQSMEQFSLSARCKRPAFQRQ